jgi:hypothetical protein
MTTACFNTLFTQQLISSNDIGLEIVPNHYVMCPVANICASKEMVQPASEKVYPTINTYAQQWRMHTTMVSFDPP